MVDKSANPTEVLFLGQVTYRVKIMNTSPESVTPTSLVDDDSVNLSGQGN